MLEACALHLPSSFDWNFCQAPPNRGPLNEAIAHEHALRQQISQVQLKIVDRPDCPPPPPVRQVPGEELAIRPGEGTGGLEGCWQTTNPMIRLIPSDVKVTITYCFDPGGKAGRLIFKQRNRKRSCEIPLQAETSGVVLNIHVDKARCPIWGNMSATEITCQLRENQPAKCDIVDMDDGKPEPRSEQILNERFRRVSP